MCISSTLNLHRNAKIARACAYISTFCNHIIPLELLYIIIVVHLFISMRLKIKKIINYITPRTGEMCYLLSFLCLKGCEFRACFFV